MCVVCAGVGVVCSEWAWLTENGQGNAMGVVYSGGRGLERRGGAEPQFRATHTRCGAGCGTGEMQPPPRKVRAGLGCSKGGIGICVWGLQREWGRGRRWGWGRE